MWEHASSVIIAAARLAANNGDIMVFREMHEVKCDRRITKNNADVAAGTKRGIAAVVSVFRHPDSHCYKVICGFLSDDRKCSIRCREEDRCYIFEQLIL